ncbi:MAG: hypothetical protein ACHQ4F_05645 [Candidatus Dormibacteria bacterium]
MIAPTTGSQQALAADAGVDLYWLPLGAGGWFVRLNGRVYEAWDAAIHRRSRCNLYHSALEVRVPSGRYVIEQAPVRDRRGDQRGVVAEGAVGSRWAAHLRIFRYEIRRWRDGVIPDLGEAVDSPRRLTDDLAVAERLLDLVPSVPTPVWGRDELHAGDMWNSNSIVAWLIASAGIDSAGVQLPAMGRAPGWHAGLLVASRAEQVGESGAGALHASAHSGPSRVTAISELGVASANRCWSGGPGVAGSSHVAPTVRTS